MESETCRWDRISSIEGLSDFACLLPREGEIELRESIAGSGVVGKDTLLGEGSGTRQIGRLPTEGSGFIFDFGATAGELGRDVMVPLETMTARGMGGDGGLELSEGGFETLGEAGEASFIPAASELFLGGNGLIDFLFVACMKASLASSFVDLPLEFVVAPSNLKLELFC